MRLENKEYEIRMRRSIISNNNLNLNYLYWIYKKKYRPSYNSGEVRATLSLQEGKMQYPAVLEDDMSCIIDFYFE